MTELRAEKNELLFSMQFLNENRDIITKLVDLGVKLEDKPFTLDLL